MSKLALAKTVTLFCALSYCFNVVPQEAETADITPTVLEVQTIDPANSAGFNIQQQWADKIKEATGGEVEINLLPTRTVVLHNETLDAAEIGAIDGYIGPMNFFAKRDPAYALLGDMVGAWNTPEAFIKFLSSDVGQALVADVHKKDNVVIIGAGTPGVETFESVQKITSVADLKGYKFRTPGGMVTNLMKNLGAEPVNLAYSGIVPAMKDKLIEGADMSVFSNNSSMGVHKYAKFPVYPTFYRSIPLVEYAIWKDAFKKLSPKNQQILKETTQAFTKDYLSLSQAADLKAIESAKQEGLEVIAWSDEEVAKVRRAAEAEWKKLATQSATANKVYNVVTEYIKANGN